MEKEIDINVIIKGNRFGNYLVNSAGKIIVDGREELCKECGQIIKKADNWAIICYLNNIRFELLKELNK